MKKFYIRVVSVAFVIITMALLLETLILWQVDKKNANRISQVLLNQVITNIQNNRRDALDLYEDFKEDYKIRAQSVAYILDAKPAAEFDIEELKKIAALLSIDEINIFDEKGTIYAGSVPHYFGMNFESGEQISYFKPMLTDKKLTMCQDVTPNTSEGKRMMYAMTWNKAGTKLVQIGIEPMRLLEVKKRSSIDSILREMPVYSGVQFFIADEATGLILASNPVDKSYRYLSDIGFNHKEKLKFNKEWEIINTQGFKNYYEFRKLDNLIVGVSYSINTNIKNFFITMHLILIYLIVAALFSGVILSSKMKSDEEKINQYNILTSMSEIYYSMHLINLKDNSVIEYSTSDFLRSLNLDLNDAESMFQKVLNEAISKDYYESIQYFTDLTTLKDRLSGKKFISTEFLSVANNWFRAAFITIEEDKQHNPAKVFFTIQSIQEQKNKEAVLVQKSTTDELTGCYNRRAYEEDLKNLRLDSDFVYVEFDINGLKPVNDFLGHEAGDEIIKSASKLMRKCCQQYGKVYRTGGDEFVAILSCTSKQFDKVIAEFNVLVDGWSGSLVKAMSVSCGSVSSREKKWNSVLHIAKEADLRMYKCKSDYYHRTGHDRRGH